MAIKICVDCGHYTNYNQGAYKPYYEGNMTWKLGQYLIQELKEYGFSVTNTRTSKGTDLGVYNRGTKAKGHDLFISLHSNACGTPSVKRVVIVKGYDQPNTLANKFGECISKAMGITEKYQIMTRKNSSGGEYYGVLRGAKAVGVKNRFILECGFHTNVEVAKWLYQDNNLKKLAQAMADMLAKHYGYKKTTNKEETKTEFKPYVVRIIYEGKDGLNIRKEPNTSSKIMGVVYEGECFTIVYEKNGFGKLKSGLGYISLNAKYVKKI